MRLESSSDHWDGCCIWSPEGSQNIVRRAQDSGPEIWGYAKDVQDFWDSQCILEEDSASCAWSCLRQLPSACNCSILDSQMIFRDMSPPMGAPRRVALSRSARQKEGEDESMLDLDSSSTQMILTCHGLGTNDLSSSSLQVGYVGLHITHWSPQSFII